MPEDLPESIGIPYSIRMNFKYLKNTSSMFDLKIYQLFPK
jgi:hypothetical protein